MFLEFNIINRFCSDVNIKYIYCGPKTAKKVVLKSLPAKLTLPNLILTSSMKRLQLAEIRPANSTLLMCGQSVLAVKSVLSLSITLISARSVRHERSSSAQT